MTGWLVLATVAVVSGFFIFVDKDKRKAFFSNKVKRLFIKDLPAGSISKDRYMEFEIKNTTSIQENIPKNIQKRIQNNLLNKTNDEDEVRKRNAIAGTFSFIDKPVQDSVRYETLLLKAEAIEKKMERLASNNDIDGLNFASLEINNLFYEIVNNKTQTELDNLLIMKAKTLMATCDDWISQSEGAKNTKREKKTKIDEIRSANNTNITYANSVTKPYTKMDSFKAGVHIAKKLDSLEEKSHTAKQQVSNLQNYDLFEYAQYLMAKADKDSGTENRKDEFNFSNFL